ncbi:MAG: hypothetical protein CL908_08725 [Deltaproteobacteria bacterium]|nr:hypothetical protein [Deltaproteobacteria bacterium]
MGGLWNAHLHLDRAATLDDVYMQSVGHRILENSHISLREKHGLIGSLHDGPAYESKDLRARVDQTIESMIEVGTTRADTLVDVTADAVGFRALEVMLDAKRARASEIDLRIGAYSPLGFRDDEPERWDVLEQGAGRADFIGALPEADDTTDYPEHVGFFEHCRRTLLLGQKLNRSVHVHTDQRNEPSENGTERLIEAVHEFGAPISSSGEPMIWAVHVISPSTYDEPRFERVVAGLLEHNIGVICCPSAAIGMRQLRPVPTPTYNSIPRVLELLAAGVHVRLASDNVADICSPSTTADLTDEVFILSAALRFYHVDVLARLASGGRPDESERAIVCYHLAHNEVEIRRALRDADFSQGS